MMSIYFGVEFIASYIETLMCWFFCRTFIANADCEKYRVLILSIIGAICAVLLNNFDLFSYISAVLAIIILGFIQIMSFRKQIGDIMVLVMIYMVTVSAIDFIVARVASILLKTDVQFLLNNESGVRIVCIIFSKMILVLFVGIIIKIHKLRGVLSKKYVVIMCLLSFFILTTNFVLIEIGSNAGKSVIELLSVMYFVLLTVLVFGVFYFLLVITDNYAQKQNVALLELQNKMIIKSQSDDEHIFSLWSKSIHDYKNNIIALKQLVEENNIEELKKYLENECKLMEQNMFCVKTGNSVVDAIIKSKRKLAEDKGIIFTVNASIFNEYYINNIDLAAIIGNLIDNAIEGSEREENSYIDVVIREEKKLLIIKVKNSFQGVFPEKNISTKHDKAFHGIGIKSVKSIVEKYHGEFEIRQVNKEVEAMAMLLNDHY